MHLTCDGKERPLSVIVTPGQRHESTQFEALLDGIGVKRVGGGRAAQATGEADRRQGLRLPEVP